LFHSLFLVNRNVSFRVLEKAGRRTALPPTTALACKRSGKRSDALLTPALSPNGRNGIEELRE